MRLHKRWAAALEGLRSQGRFRTLSRAAGADFSSNDYLGYAAGRLPVNAPWNSLPESRSGASSRLLRGHLAVWDEVESALARWHGAEAALVMTSGYVANEGLLVTILEPGDWVASDRLNHASIIDGLRLSRADRFVYHHRDLNHLEGGLRTAARARSRERELFVVTESLFGMDGDAAPLGELVGLAAHYGAHVVVDEAHATGCFGERGSGLVDAAGLRDRVLATVHTGGKALAVPGAYVCGSGRLKELLVNRCRQFIYTTALPPAVGAWWLESVRRAEADAAGRALLHANAARFRKALQAEGISAPGESYIVPVILGDDCRAVKAAHALQAAGWDIRAIRPPTVPDGTARLRLSVHADHTHEQLDAAAVAVAEAISRR